MEKLSLRNKRILYVILICIIAALSTVSGRYVSPAFAETSQRISYDSTDPLDDLMEVEGFDIANYPTYKSNKPEMHVANFVEYCYPYYANMNSNYGLYFYLYNPNLQDIIVNSVQNKVMIAVKYDSSPVTSKSNPTDYEKFGLEFCSVSQHPDYKNLFYKFKVLDHKSADGKTIFERVNNQARRYDIGEIELLTKGNDTATAYAITGLYAVQNPEHKNDAYGTFTFTGYASGYGENENGESTLDCKITFLESVSLEVKHSFYRTKTSSKGKGHQNQLDSVYFSVPKRLFDTYGKLQKIKAEWYEYKTKEIIVTSNKTMYETLLPYMGVSIGDYDKYGYLNVNKDVRFGMGLVIGADETGNAIYDWTYNLHEYYSENKLYSLFYNSDINVYDPYADITANGGVTSNKLYDYIKTYHATFDNGTLPIKNGTISADLFESDIDEERKADTDFGKIQQGYSYYDFDADLDLQEWTSWSGSNPDFWQNIAYAGFWNTLFGKIPAEENVSISPIHIIDKNDMADQDIDVANRLYMQWRDVADLRDVYNEAITVDKSDLNDEEKVVVLFHFATSDYVSQHLRLIDHDAKLGSGSSDGQVYMAQQSVFFDFDIIQLTFNDEGVYTVIPVVSSPIDIVNPVTPPSYDPNDDGMPWWLKLIIAVVLIILIVILLWQTGLLPFATKAVVWVVSAPFKGMAWFVRWCKETNETRKERKAQKQSRQRRQRNKQRRGNHEKRKQR